MFCSEFAQWPRAKFAQWSRAMERERAVRTEGEMGGCRQHQHKNEFR